MNASTGFIYVAVVLFLLSPRAFPNPIPRCEDLLTEAREYLARTEYILFERERGEHSALPTSIRGLLLAVYERHLDGELMTMSDACDYVPAVPITAGRHIKNAADDGLLIVKRSPYDGRQKLIRPGPRLEHLVRAELSAHLDQMYEDANHLPLPNRLKVGRPPARRSYTLNRMISKKIGYEYNRVWCPGAANDQVHLRHTYGLLVQVYRRGKRGLSRDFGSVRWYVPISNYNSRQKFVDAAVSAGLIEVVHRDDGNHVPRLFATPRTIALVEGRINGGIDRTNAILRRAIEEHR